MFTSVTSGIIKFDKDDALTPSGTSQDIAITASLQNLTGTPTFSLLDADGTSQMMYNLLQVQKQETEQHLQ